MNERVSWLLPVKNGMPYLPSTLASIAAQTYAEHFLLVWDNGSNDGTVEELHRWIPSVIPGRIVTGRPLTLAQSLAALVELSETEFLARIDADDLADADRLEQQLAFMQKHPEVGVLGTQMRHIDSNGEVLPSSKRYPVEHDDIVNTFLVENPIGHPTVLLRKSEVLRVGSYRPEGPSNVEDYDLWIRIAMRSRLMNLDQALTSYRIHSTSTTQTILGQNKLNDVIDNMLSTAAPELYGCTAAEVLGLRKRSLKNAWPVVRKIAQRLAERSEQTLETRLSQTSFLDAMQLLLSPRDFRSHLEIASRRPDPIMLEHEWRHMDNFGPIDRLLNWRFNLMITRQLSKQRRA